MKVTRTLTALAVAVPVALAAGQAADATSPPAQVPTSFVGHPDPAGDVQTFFGSVHPDPPAQQVLPTRRNGDITRVRLTHTTNTVRVALRFRELNPGGEQHAYVVRFVTPRLERIVYFGAYQGKYGPIDRAAYWSGTKPTMYGPAGYQKKCIGMTRTIDYQANTVLLVVPRSCLGYPKTVSVGPRVAIVTNYQSGTFDDGYGSGGSYADPPATGPRAWHPGSY